MKSGVLQQLDSFVGTVRWHCPLKHSFLSKYYKLINFLLSSANR